MSPRLIATGAGIDSGTTLHAIATLEAFDDGMIWPRELVYIAYERTRVSNLFELLRPRGDAAQGVVAIETITGGLYGNAAERRKRFAGVANTKGSEALFRQLCLEKRIPIVNRPASHGRKVIIGSGTASDDQIRAGIEGIYTTITPGDDLPPVPALHRPHIYDAMIVGMTELYERMAGVDHEGARTSAGPLVNADLARRIQLALKFPGHFLPDDVRLAVAMIRGKEQAFREEARLREKLGLGKATKPRRIPTRATAAAGKAKSAATRINNKLART